MSDPFSCLENWQKAIGTHVVWGNADVIYDCTTKSYEMTLKIEMEDFYNFNKGQSDIASGIPDDANGRFEVLGWAKSFYSRGYLTRNITWIENEIADTTKIDGVSGRKGRRGRR